MVRVEVLVSGSWLPLGTVPGGQVDAVIAAGRAARGEYGDYRTTGVTLHVAARPNVDFTGATVVAVAGSREDAAKAAAYGVHVFPMLEPKHRAFRAPRVGDVLGLCVGDGGWSVVAPSL